MSSTRTSGVHEPPYTGTLGITRREAFFLPTPEGAAQRIELVTVVNTLTDPVLARRCLDGTLHRIEGTDYAQTVIYHDPAARRFVLVVPVARAYEDLTLRAKLLTALTADPSAHLPGYVREATTVIGPSGLRAWLDRSVNATQDPAISAQRAQLDQRAEILSQRETALSARETELSAQLDCLAADQELLRANISALTAREQLLRAREESLAQRELSVSAMLSADEVIELHQEPFEENTETEPEENTPRPSLNGPAIEPPATNVTLEIDPLPAFDDGEETLDPSVETNTADGLEESEESVTETQGERERDSGDKSLWVTLPRAAVIEGSVHLWLKGGTDEARALAAGDLRPTLQTEPEGGEPLALLSLRDTNGNPLARIALDFTRPEGRAVIDTLARDFRVRAELVSATGRALAVQSCSAPCEAVAVAITEVLAGRAGNGLEARERESQRFVTEGLDDDSTAALSAGVDEQSLTTVNGVRDAMQTWEPLFDVLHAGPVALKAGVSQTQIESAARKITLAALRCGEPLGKRLSGRAVALGLASDGRALATLALTVYARAVEGGVEALGRSVAEASRAWRPLIENARALGAVVPDTVAGAVAKVWDPDDAESTAPPDERTPPTEEALRVMSPEVLDAWRWHPTVRLKAAMVRVEREELRETKGILEALRWLPVDEAAKVAAELVTHGDDLGDLWVELLRSTRQGLVCIGAAGAGVLRLRRALSPLVQNAVTGDEESWRVMAWAAGCFGPSLVRAVARLDAGDPDRIAWMLGLAVDHGGAREMDRARGASGLFDDCATKALGLQDELRQWSDALKRGVTSGRFERAVRPVIERGEPTGEG